MHSNLGKRPETKLDHTRLINCSTYTEVGTSSKFRYRSPYAKLSLKKYNHMFTAVIAMVPGCYYNMKKCVVARAHPLKSHILYKLDIIYFFININKVPIKQ
jgi:hypothetical protein